MIEHLLNIVRQGTNDNSDLPFPSGTPYKGVVSASSFITGDALAEAVNVTEGVSMNTSAGWLHFIEDDGMELYIAKKPLRHSITYDHLNAAGLVVGKDIDIGGETYVCRLMRGALVTNGGFDNSNGGGEWNRYMYNVSGGVGRPSFPVDTPVWGNYSDSMLGIGLLRYGLYDDGSFNICRDPVGNGGYICRGMNWTGSDVPNIMGVWYVAPGATHSGFSWRPMLIKKSTIPEIISPYKGVVSGAALITGEDLTTELGLEATGEVFGDGNPGWLHYVDEGKTFYIAKNPLRTSVLWETLDAMGAVTGTKQVTIGGKQYKVRLMTGGDTDPVIAPGGEYDKYFARTTEMYTGAIDDRYANLTAADVGFIAGTANGALCLCQSWWSTNGPLTRGYPGFYDIWHQAPGATHSGYSWRPVLELIP